MTSISYRRITAADDGILYAIYASTRTEELAQLPWSEQEKRDFLRMQFEAQHKFYQQQFANAAFQIIEQHGEPIGRLYVDRREDEIRVIDLALLPEHRRKGLGTRLMREVLEEAASANKPVRIHVEQNNPALRLYERLGFRNIDDHGVYFLLEWTPG